MKSLQEQLGEVKKVLECNKSKESALEAHQEPNQAKNIIVAGKKYKVCPKCGCRLRPGHFTKHMSKQHGYPPTRHNDTPKQAVLVDSDNEFTTCPKCNKAVKKKNLKKHIRRIHKNKVNAKNKKVNKRKSKIIPLPDHKMTPEVAAELRKALEETDIVKDKSIAEYLEKNPLKDETGKFGVPQDKYRWGFYGSKSMEYDNWGKGDKNK